MKLDFQLIGTFIIVFCELKLVEKFGELYLEQIFLNAESASMKLYHFG